MPKVTTKFLIPQFMFSHFSHHVCTGVLVPLLPLLREVFGLNYFQSGILVSSFGIAYGFGQVPMAILADRFSRRLIIILGLLGISLAGMSISLTQDFRQMVPFLIIMGLLGGTYHAPASSFISQVLPPEKRGQALGLHFTGGSFSFFLTPALALGIATLFDSWRSSFFILALPALLASTILWLTTEEPQDLVLIQSDQKNDHDSNSNQDRITWFQIIRAIGLLVSLAILLNVVFASANSYMPLYMVDHHNISPRWAGIVVSVIAGAGIIGAPLGGALSDRLGRKQLILFSLTLAGPLFFAMTRSPFGILLLLSLVSYGLVMSVRMPSTESLIADVVPVGKRTTVLAIYFFLGMETASIVTPIVGRLIDIFGLDHVFTVMAACLCMIAGVALLFRKRI
jgi:FSR family fosmidomycin resistance protein-like MFS transporter